MKLSYKKKLFLSLLVIFTLFTAGIIGLEQTGERRSKTESLEVKMDAYTEIIRNAVSENPVFQKQLLDNLAGLFPSDMRLTLIDRKGTVFYDNIVNDVSVMENHANRPEIKKAFERGKGTIIRFSETRQQEYLYYAKRMDTYCIRVALPYDIQLRHFLKSDNLFLGYIIVLFAVIVIVIVFVAERFGKSIRQLKDFVVISEKEEMDFSTMNFPDDELGEIGAKIIDNYKQLKNSKLKITQEREKLLQHVHSSGEGLCFFSAEKEVEFYNGLFVQYLNMIADEANSDPRIVFSDASFNEFNACLLAGSGEKKYVEMQINTQGKTFSVGINFFDDNGFEMILNDITRQEKTRLLKQEMTGNIAHELRTPVTSIRGYLETILEQPLDEDKKRYFITQSFNQTLVLSELIQDLSLITRMEEAPQSFHLEQVNINRLLEELKKDLDLLLQEKSICMEWNIPAELEVNGNRNLLYAVFRNLTDNVIRYAGSDVRIWISNYNEDNNYYYFSYSDTGVGISGEHHLNRLFERFYRINEGRTRDTGGSGLGLSIVKNAIAFHKGTIDAKNKPGGGLEFLFKLQKR